MRRKALTYILLSVASAGTIGLASVKAASAETKSTAQQSHHGHTHKVKVDARLSQAVRDGTITSTQAAALKTELKTLHHERANTLSKSSTKAERQATRAKLKAELKAWASTNHFPLSKLYSKLDS